MGVGCLVKRITGKKVGTQSSQSKLIKKRVLFMEIVSNVEPRKNVTWEWEDKNGPSRVLMFTQPASQQCLRNNNKNVLELSNVVAAATGKCVSVRSVTGDYEGLGLYGCRRYK